MHGILPDIGISILAATALAFVFQFRRQPAILGCRGANEVLLPYTLIGDHLARFIVANHETGEA